MTSCVARCEPSRATYLMKSGNHMLRRDQNRLTRRTFMVASMAGAAMVCSGLDEVKAQNGTDRPGGPPPPADPTNVPAVTRALKPMTAGIVPISDDERNARIEKARRLMREQLIDALILEGGSSLYYFTGVRWALSERPFVA